MGIVELFEKGGVMMYFILAASVAALAVFIEKLWALGYERVVPASFVRKITHLLEKGDVDTALTACKEDNSPTARVIAQGLRYIHLGRREAREAMNDVGQIEVQEPAKWSSVIGVSATISPLLGLLGTVLGMIKVFVDLSQYENPAIGVLARGIYEALITTAAGLPVGIIAFLFHTYVQSRVDRLAAAMEEVALRVLDTKEPGEDQEG